ncbi:hypothetical protein KEM48_003137 [Puccinia striiformis f. sp. tritici PST-130]|nr:hypothetical protein KEM48_003137 [Puccinia striiformis f. sp. tritici PST-130]
MNTLQIYLTTLGHMRKSTSGSPTIRKSNCNLKLLQVSNNQRIQSHLIFLDLIKGQATSANLPQHPGPYKEFDFSVLFLKDVQIQPGSTSSIQQPIQKISSDLPGLGFEAVPQEFEPRPMQVEDSQA